MRFPREVTAKQEDFRVEELKGTPAGTVRRGLVKPEPEGTFVLKPFRIAGYDRDCDGSALARLDAIDWEGRATGAEMKGIGLHPGNAFVISELELRNLAIQAFQEKLWYEQMSPAFETRTGDQWFPKRGGRALIVDELLGKGRVAVHALGREDTSWDISCVELAFDYEKLG